MPAGTGAVDNPVPITSERSGHFTDAIRSVYQQLGLHEATDHALSPTHVGLLFD